MVRNWLVKAVGRRLLGGGGLLGGRLRRRLFMLFLLCMVGLFFAPGLIGRTSIVEDAINKNLAGGRIEIGSKKLGWFSAVKLKDVVLRDDKDEVLAHVETLQVSKTVLGLLFNRSHLGTVQLSQPSIVLSDLSSRSNWEAFAAKLMEQPASDSPLVMKLALSEGKIFVRQGEAEPTLLVDQLNGEATLAGGDVAGSVSGIRANQPDSQIAVELNSSNANGKTDAEGKSLAITAKQFPLEDIQPVLRRFVSDLSARGQVSGRMDWFWSPTTRLVFKDVRGDQLRLSMPSLLKQDEFHSAVAHGNGELVHDGDHWLIQNVALDAGVGEVQIAGSIPLSTIRLSDDPTQWLPQRQLQVTGSADLAAIVNMMPRALRVHQSLQMTSGDLRFDLRSKAGEGTWIYEADVQTSNVVAQRGQQRIEWQKPFQFVASIQRSNSELMVKQLECRSSFLTATGSGNSQAGRLSANGDLSRLMTELSNFVDVRQPLQGRFQVGLAWQTRDGRLTIQGAGLEADDGRAGIPTRAMIVDDFSAPLPGGKTWRETKIEFDLLAEAIRQQSGFRIASGNVVARSQNGLLDGRLTREVDIPFGVPTQKSARQWPVAIVVMGDLAQWHDRLTGLFGKDSFIGDVAHAKGRAELRASVLYGTDSMEVSEGRITVRDLDLGLAGKRINEPVVECQLTGMQLSWQPWQCLIDDTTITTSTIALRAREFKTGRDSDGRLAVSANLGYRADVARIGRWLQPMLTGTSQPSKQSMQLWGTVLGQAEISTTGATVIASVSGDVTNAQLAMHDNSSALPVSTGGRQRVVWREPTVRFEGSIQVADGKLRFQDFSLAGHAIRVSVSGEFGSTPDGLQLAVEGQTSYDLDKLTQQLKPLFGDSVIVKGQSLAPLSFVGKLPTSSTPDVFATWQGATKLQWTEGNFFGLPFGRATVDAKLSGGVVSLTPLAMKVGDGQIAIAPEIDLRSSPQVLTVKRDKLVDRVRLSPEICRDWLRYVAPIAADATQADGTFSVVGEATVPLGNTRAMKSELDVEVHEARIGPGPLARELIWIAKQVKAIVRKQPLSGLGGGDRDWLVFPKQTIGVRVVNGRVHHENLQMLVGDVIVVTHGSVGLDQRLDLVAKIPIRKEWVANDRLMQRMAGQSVSIPIRGTVSRPSIDKKALRQLGNQTLESAGAKLLEEQLDRGLRKLFGRD